MTMPDKRTTIVLNSFGSGSLERRSRVSASGNTSNRYTVSLDAKPLALDFDTKELGAGVAQRIALHLRQRIADIGGAASDATLRRRAEAAKAFTAGKPWALKEYSGGRIGAMPPNQSTRLFNDSGRLVSSLVAAPTKDNNWIINVAANRLNAARLGSETKLVAMIDRLRSFVPEFGSAALLAAVPEIQAEIGTAIWSIYGKTARRSSRLRGLAKELLNVAVRGIAA